MYPDGLGIVAVLVGVSIIWSAVLTFLMWRERLFLKKLFPQQGKSFKDRLEELFKEVTSLEGFKRQSLEHVQKVALKRYNPYQDTGGDQSFSLALLDALGNGVVLTSLHSRAGTRVFAKPVKGGKEEKFEFSDEETEVVKLALKND